MNYYLAYYPNTKLSATCRATAMATNAKATSTVSCTATAVADHMNLEDVTVEDDKEETSSKEEKNKR